MTRCWLTGFIVGTANLGNSSHIDYCIACNTVLTQYVAVSLMSSGAPHDGFLTNALKRCFRLSGVLLKLCRLILDCAIKFLSVRFC